MENAQRQNYCAQSLALAFIFCACGYAFPGRILPASFGSPFIASMSPEVLNLYTLVCWMGLAHFVYAYHGQGNALRRNTALISPFVLSLVVGSLVLAATRSFLGFALFSLAMWVYFIPHLVKAELHFNRIQEGAEHARGWSIYWFPALCFSYLTLVLFCPMEWLMNGWSATILFLAICFVGSISGVWKQLKNRDLTNYVLIAFFILAEGLVWATYRKYMVFQFQQGVYVFHIAMASFYHYFRCYDFAATARGAANYAKYIRNVWIVNLLVIACAWTILQFEWLKPVSLIADVTFFTFWVGLHQFSSDMFNYFKARLAARSKPATQPLHLADRPAQA